MMSELMKNILNDAINTENLNTIEIYLTNSISITVIVDDDIHKQMTVDSDKVTITRVMYNGCKKTSTIPLANIIFVNVIEKCPTMEAE